MFPAAKDALVFTDGAARLANTNDLPHGTEIGTITLGGNGYAIAGNAITLTDGIVENAPAPGARPQLAVDIALGQSQLWVQGDVGFVVNGNIAIGTNSLTLR